MRELEEKRLQFQKGKQRELFDHFFKIRNFTQRKLAETLGVPRRTVTGYFNGQNNITYSVFQKLVQLDQKTKDFEQFIEKKLPINWGAREGGLATAIGWLISFLAGLNIRLVFIYP